MQVRPACPQDAQRIAQIHVASWQKSFRGIMPDDFLDRQNADERCASWRDNMRNCPGNLLVVDNDYGIFGFSCSGPIEASKSPPYDGQIFGIHVDPGAKRQGFGRRLMIASFDRLASLGCAKALLWTLELNIPARHFYGKMGGRVVEKRPIIFGGKELVEVAYGWDRLAVAG